jgi:hypothetical protein
MASPYHGDAVSREICRVLRLAYLGDRLEVVQYVRTLRLRLQIRLGPLGQRFKTNQLRTVSEQTLRQHQTQVRTSWLGRHGKRRAMIRLLAMCLQILRY